MTTTQTPDDDISDLIFGSLRAGQDGEEPVVFQESACAAVAEYLDTKIEDGDFVSVCHRVLLISYLLDSERKSPSASKQLADVLERDANVARMRRVAGGDDIELHVHTEETQAEAVTRGFKSLTATAEVKKAPIQDAPAPEGALKLSRLVQPGVFNDPRRPKR
jgi:hypothetical protein